jgi:hypothetical protein
MGCRRTTRGSCSFVHWSETVKLCGREGVSEGSVAKAAFTFFCIWAEERTADDGGEDDGDGEENDE